MSLFKLDLRNKTVPQKITLGNGHIAAMAEADALVSFPIITRLPADTLYATTVANLESTNAAADAAEIAWKQANALRDAAEVEFDRQTTARANNCEAAQPGNVAALTSTGLPMRAAAVPTPPLGAPQNLRATMGVNAGEMILQWEPAEGVSSTLLKYKEHLVAGEYTQADATTKSKQTISGLTPGKTYAFLAQFVGKDGLGPWSDEAVKMAP